MYEIFLTSRAKQDLKKVERSYLKEKFKELIEIVSKNPYANPPHYEKLSGDLRRAISRRINVQHRLVYEVNESKKIVKILSMWTHYE